MEINSVNSVFTAEKRLTYYRWLTAAAIAVTVIVLWKLWSGDRTYPTAPIIGTQSYIFGSLSVFFRVAIIASAILFALNVKYSGWFLAILLVIGFVDDFNRLTPNTYQYCVIAVLFAITGSNNLDNLSGSLKIIQAGFYLWTGILKLNMGFINQISDFIYTTIHFSPPTYYLKFVLLAIPIMEIAIAWAFISGKRIREAILLSFILHGFLIIFLLMAHWNMVIISYNIFLPLGNVILFYPSSAPLFEGFKFPRPFTQKIATCLFMLLPALNLFRLWPDFMSCSLYSCKSLYGFVSVDEKLKKQLGPSARRALVNNREGECISYMLWVEDETGSVPNPQRFVFEKMFAQMHREYSCSDSVKLWIK